MMKAEQKVKQDHQTIYFDYVLMVLRAVKESNFVSSLNLW